MIFQWIYDYEKAYEIINDSFKMHIPINTNQNRILNIKTENIDDLLSFSFSLTKSFENHLFGVIKQITIGGGNSNNKLHFAMNGGLYNYHVYFDKIHITYERSLYNNVDANLYISKPNNRFEKINFKLFINGETIITLSRKFIRINRIFIDDFTLKDSQFLKWRIVYYGLNF